MYSKYDKFLSMIAAQCVVSKSGSLLLEGNYQCNRRYLAKAIRLGHVMEITRDKLFYNHSTITIRVYTITSEGLQYLTTKAESTSELAWVTYAAPYINSYVAPIGTLRDDFDDINRCKLCSDAMLLAFNAGAQVYFPSITDMKHIPKQTPQTPSELSPVDIVAIRQEQQTNSDHGINVDDVDTYSAGTVHAAEGTIVMFDDEEDWSDVL